MPSIHHSAICVRDMDARVRFGRDGLGFAVLIDAPAAAGRDELTATPTPAEAEADGR